MAVSRVLVYSEVIQAYKSNSQLHDSHVQVNFKGEKAVDLDGVSRELFSLFWNEARDMLFEGVNGVSPVVDPLSSESFYTIGRILSHGFVLTGYFPICLVPAVAVHLVSGDESQCSDATLLDSFLSYVSGFEKSAVLSFLSTKTQQPPSLDVVVSLLSRYQCHSIPKNAEELKRALINVAKTEFFYKPAHALAELRRGMLAAHPSVWRSVTPQGVCALYAQLTPTNQKVSDLIEGPEEVTAQENQCLEFLHRFIMDLTADDLSRFLRFCTGSSVCTVKCIQVGFNQMPASLLRRPFASSCGATLQLPSTYNSYRDLQREFSHILKYEEYWYMDIV